MRAFVLDRNKRPLDPTTPARAKRLLKKGRARVHRLIPFTIRLTDRTIEGSTVHDYAIGIDPGSRTTGIALAREVESVDTTTGEVTTERTGVALIELAHRGPLIKKKLEQRAAYRRRRRSRNLRYRAPRFNNRTRKSGWLPPSLAHRVETTLTWVDRLSKLAPVSVIAYEAVRFDTQALQDPGIAGVEYQQGTLFGMQVREYLLEKYQRTCVYCDATGVPLNLDHVIPRARGGSDRVSNLVLACITCNQAKGAMRVEDFVTDPARLARTRRQQRMPLRDAASVNTTRRALHRRLTRTGLPVVAASGARTKWNRARLGVPKTHALDALCVGETERVTGWPGTVLVVRATGRGTHQRTTPDKHGFPRLYRTRQKMHHGLITGDIVSAVVPMGRKRGTYMGRVAVRVTGSCNITTTTGVVQGISHKHIRLRQRGDGYQYTREEVPGFLPALTDGATAGQSR